jgi:hypothetical protein
VSSRARIHRVVSPTAGVMGTGGSRVPSAAIYNMCELVF